MSSATKQKSHAARNVLIFFIVFTVLVAAFVIGLSIVFKNKDVTPSIGGYSLYIMDTDKMGDSVPRGSLVLAANETPSAEKLGRAVLCEKVPGVGTSVFYLADVSAKEGQDGVYYTIFQEKNKAITYEVKSENVVGEATTYYTMAGKVITFMISRFGMVICIGSPIALLIIIELIIAIASSDGYDDDDDYNEDERYYDENKEDKRETIDDILFSGDDSTPISQAQLDDDEYISDDESISVDEDDDADIIGEQVEVDENIPETRLDDIDTSDDEDEEESETSDEELQETESETIKVKLPPVEKDDSDPVNLKVKIPESKPYTPKKTNVPKAKRPARASLDTSLEDLVKLMEEQQKKLREEIDNNK
ncbi:MAG: hypothetical protein IJ740_00480 [Ruminococcus sp.]|nr:hypothetical protein [Ruminococcus sp.]